MKVLLSIKPEFAEKIFAGTKLFEFRRSIFKKNVTTVVVYASFPTCKVIGEFKIGSIINDNIDRLWTKTKKYAGIDKDFFYSYFDNKSEGFAIQITKTKRYRKPLCIKEDFNRLPPQSFTYIPG